MKSLRKLFPYIVLNIVISAATTLVVLWLWDFIIHPQITANSNPPSTTEISAPTTTVLLDTDEGNATQDQPTVIIENVLELATWKQKWWFSNKLEKENKPLQIGN